VSEDYAVRTYGLSREFGSVKALVDVDLSVPAGTMLAVLGPNGAGKTTLVRILTTLLPPTGGRAEVAGFDVVREAGKVREVIGLSGQAAAVDDFLTGRENLEMVGRLLHLGRAGSRARAEELLARFSLNDAEDRPAKTYSGGMRRRLDLATTLVGHAPVLFLDEPTAGLDPRSRLDLWATIRSLVDGGSTVLLTTQYLEEADQLADRIVVFDQGLIIAEGTSDELKSRVGGDRLQLAVVEPADAGRAAAEIADLGSGPAQVDSGGRSVVLPVTAGTAVLPEVVRRLDAAHVRLSDLAIRRPTLDDAFLALTGRQAADAQDSADRVDSARTEARSS
jgi:ABC-2 type transport system ATP-binding protein